MAQNSKEQPGQRAQREREEYGEEYELMPHKEILELRDELHKLKMRPNEKTLQLSMVELSAKVDKLIDIFSEAMHEIRIEEGGLTFQDKMKPMVDRMDKVLEQNSQIAEGVVAIADLVNELKDIVPSSSSSKPSFSSSIPDLGPSSGGQSGFSQNQFPPPPPSQGSPGPAPGVSPQPPSRQSNQDEDNQGPQTPPRMPPPPTRQ